jgi:hypothetical protein
MGQIPGWVLDRVTLFLGIHRELERRVICKVDWLPQNGSFNSVIRPGPVVSGAIHTWIFRETIIFGLNSFLLGSVRN